MIVLVKFVVFCILLSDGLNSASSTPTVSNNNDNDNNN